MRRETETIKSGKVNRVISKSVKIGLPTCAKSLLISPGNPFMKSDSRNRPITRDRILGRARSTVGTFSVTIFHETSEGPPIRYLGIRRFMEIPRHVYELSEKKKVKNIYFYFWHFT